MAAWSNLRALAFAFVRELGMAWYRVEDAYEKLTPNRYSARLKGTSHELAPLLLAKKTMHTTSVITNPMAWVVVLIISSERE